MTERMTGRTEEGVVQQMDVQQMERTTESPRLAEFERAVEGLRTASDLPRSERTLLGLGLVLVAFGFVMFAVGWYGASGTREVSEQIPYLLSAGCVGLGAAVAGAALYLRFSLGRYLRYWLLREMHEQRELNDRAVAALERIEALLRADARGHFPSGK